MKSSEFGTETSMQLYFYTLLVQYRDFKLKGSSHDSFYFMITKVAMNLHYDLITLRMHIDGIKVILKSLHYEQAHCSLELHIDRLKVILKKFQIFMLHKHLHYVQGFQHIYYPVTTNI